MTNMIIPGQDPLTTLVHRRSTVTFDGTTGGGEAGTNVTVFTITGRVHVAALIPYCTVNLTESGATATIKLGVTNKEALFISIMNAVDLDADEFWIDATPDADGVAIPNAMKEVGIAQNIVVLPETTNVTAGTIIFDVWYYPITDNGALS
jgi:hypothetical protein